MRNKHSLIFGLAVLLLVLVIGLPFLLKGVKSGPGQGVVYAHVQNKAVMGPRQTITLQFSAPMAVMAQVNETVTMENAPLTLSPAIAGEGVWTTDRTFVFTPHVP